MIRVIQSCWVGGMLMRPGAKVSLSDRDERILVIDHKAAQISSGASRDADAVADTVPEPEPKARRKRGRPTK